MCDFYELLTIYIALSIKIDTYYTVYILAAGSLLALPIPKGNLVVAAGVGLRYILIFVGFSFLNSFALHETYAAAGALGNEMVECSEKTRFYAPKSRAELKQATDVLEGAWINRIIIAGVILVILVTGFRVWWAAFQPEDTKAPPDNEVESDAIAPTV